MASWEDFQKIEMRVGEIQEVEEFTKARNPSYILKIFFGEEIGLKKSSAQITNYSIDELVGRQVICVTNFPPKQIGPIMSEVLVLGVKDKNSESIILLKPSTEAQVGERVY